MNKIAEIERAGANGRIRKMVKGYALFEEELLCTLVPMGKEQIK